MKTFAASAQAYLDAGGNVAVNVELYTLTLADGVTVFRWSTASTDITISGTTWNRSGPNAPIVIPTGTSYVQLPAVDQATFQVVGGAFTLNGGQTMMVAAAARYFSGARWQVDVLIGPDLPTAIAWGLGLPDFEGPVTDVSPSGDGTLTLTANSETIKLNRNSPFRAEGWRCPWTVYDKNCDPGQTLLAAKTLTGAASGTPTTTKIPTASGALTAKAAGYFNLGFLVFTSGALNGQSFDVDTWDGTNFFMAAPLASAPAAGDTFTVAPGCPNTLAVCSSTFANTANWGGFLHIPTTEAAT